jgi:tetratricopeptide (TPR) repeat protein
MLRLLQKLTPTQICTKDKLPWMNHQTLRSLSVLVLTKIILLLGLFASWTAVEAKPSQLIQNNPLDLMEPDPLLPNPPKNGELASPERERLAQALDQLNIEAMTQLQAGNTLVAFTIWNRELRLRRYLGPMAELAALKRVGALAWQQEQTTQLYIITQRLETLQIEYCNDPNKSENSCDWEFLRELAQGYESVKARDFAIQVYQTLLADAQNRQDIETVKTLLTTIARLSLEKLDYVGAASAYEQLLAIAESEADQAQVINYVETLTDVYTQGRQREKAIAMRQRLIEFYLNGQDMRLIPELKFAIGQDYQSLNQPILALTTYQESYTLAWTLQQFYLAREALVQIASIYEQMPELEKALQVYEALLVVDQRASNLYGLMTTYLQLGELQKTRQNYPQAIAAFQKGLEISQQLNSTEYQSDFRIQLQELKQP